MPVIHWFRRDLRLHDNTALTAAAQASDGAVIPVFLLDDRLLDPGGRFTGAARVRFLLASLHALAAALRQQGTELVIRRGNPQDELLKVAQESGATAVYWNRDYSPYATARDRAVERTLRAAGYTVHSFHDAVIWAPDAIVTQAGTPYTVYTPYARQWRQRLTPQHMQVATIPTLHPLADARPASIPLPTLDELGLRTVQQALPGGAEHGQALLHRFTDLAQPHSIATYKTDRDMLALPGTSRLSAHLHLGTVSPRACLQAAWDIAQGSRGADASAGAQAWMGELAWRDFYIQILAHFPHVLRGAFKQQYDGLHWQNNEEHFAAWCAGNTGYPVVDAAMRQLQSEAWMHNRGRMITASFLTKDLLIDWRWGERYFMQQLVDGDVAANNGGWQWTAGTGTDAQPYFRIFNPTSQGQKFDPAGTYVRRYIPELAAVPDSFIHEPWQMSATMQQHCGVQIGRDYPAPIVDHAVQRQQALVLYAAAQP